jgi:hypothetical protein
VIAVTRAARARRREVLHARILAYLAAHPDSSGLDVTRGVHRHAMLGLLDLEYAGKVQRRWVEAPIRRVAYSLAEESIDV